MWPAFTKSGAKTAFPLPDLPRFLCIVCQSNTELSLHSIINTPMWGIQRLAIWWGVCWVWLETCKRSFLFWSGLHPLHTVCQEKKRGCKKNNGRMREDLSGNRDLIQNNYRRCLKKSWLLLQLFNCRGKNMPTWVGYGKTLSTLRCFKPGWIKQAISPTETSNILLWQWPSWLLHQGPTWRNSKSNTWIGC